MSDEKPTGSAADERSTADAAPDKETEPTAADQAQSEEVSAAGHGEGHAPDTAATDEQANRSGVESTPKRSRFGGRVPAAVTAVAVVVACVFGTLYVVERADSAQAQDTLSAMKSERAENSAAVKAATDYVTQFLNYSYKNLDEFFANFAHGLAKEDAERWKKLEPILRPTLEKRKVESEGKVTYAAHASVVDGLHKVLVYGKYTYTNVDSEKPKAADVAMLVSVRKVDGDWVVESVDTPTAGSGGLSGAMSGAPGAKTGE